MKIKSFFRKATLSVAISLVVFASCSKEGPQGPNGEQGEQGIQGEIGPAGADGSVIYSSEGKLDGSIGVEGDYYLNTTTGELWGPKLDDYEWDDANHFSLSGNDGQDGEDGTDGSQILSGSGAPALDVGKAGDYYLDCDSYTLYGPKPLVTKGWGLGLVLKGADGNANVKTYMLTIAPDDWTLGNFLAERKKRTYTKNWAVLEDYFESGIVLVYLQKVIPLVSTTYYELPYTEYAGTGIYIDQWSMNVTKAAIHVIGGSNCAITFTYTRNRINGTTALNNLSGVSETYKILLVEGSEVENLSAAAIDMGMEISEMSFEQVSNILNSKK